MKPIKNKAANWLIDILVMIIGNGIFALGVHSFTAPNDIAPGGVTGIATVINTLINMPIGTIVAIINIPLVLLGFKFLRLKPMIRTIISIVLFTVLMDFAFVNIPVYKGDPMLAAIFGGAMIGFGIGLVYIREGTTGGVDITNRIIQQKFPYIKLSNITFMTDLFTIIIAVFTYKNIEVALYAIIAMFVSSRVLDGILYGMSESKMLMIVTDFPDEIAAEIIKLPRGVTKLKGIGAYSGKDKTVVMCVTARNQYYRIRRRVQAIDPKAFMIISDASEVLGEGFKERSY